MADQDDVTPIDIDLHRKFMEAAVEEARKCVSEDGRISPKVAAIVVRNGKELARAFRGEIRPGDHAEYTVLEKKLADVTLAGSTVYTTLEPCTERSRDKVPCVDRLIERKVRQVVIGTLDPNPDILGEGLWKLRDARIKVALFEEEPMFALEEMNRDFIRQHRGKAKNLHTAKHGLDYFVGKWRVGHGDKTPGLFLIDLNDDRTATKSHVPDATGTWEYIRGEALISWSDGWQDVIRRTPDGELKIAYKKPGDPPHHESKAQRMT